MNIATTTEEYQKLPDPIRRDTYLPEDLATAYPIIESNELLIALETIVERTPSVRLILNPIAPGFKAKDLKLRKSAVEKLEHALRTLPKGIHLKILEAYRPLSIQRQYFAEVEADIRQREGLSGKALWERVTQFVADPELCPPHTTGGAIDCTLVGAMGTELDMGSPMNEVSDLSNTFASGLSDEAQKNRMLLYETLTQSGFVNLPTEWWHYSFGDQYWAAYTGAAAAWYGSTDG